MFRSTERSSRCPSRMCPVRLRSGGAHADNDSVGVLAAPVKEAPIDAVPGQRWDVLPGRAVVVGLELGQLRPIGGDGTEEAGLPDLDHAAGARPSSNVTLGKSSPVRVEDRRFPGQVHATGTIDGSSESRRRCSDHTNNQRWTQDEERHECTKEAAVRHRTLGVLVVCGSHTA